MFDWGIFQWGLVIAIIVVCFVLSVSETWGLFLVPVGVSAVTFAYPYVAHFWVDKMPKNPVDISSSVLLWVCGFFIVISCLGMGQNVRTTKSGKADKCYAKQQKELDEENEAVFGPVSGKALLTLGCYFGVKALLNL